MKTKFYPNKIYFSTIIAQMIYIIVEIFYFKEKKMINMSDYAKSVFDDPKLLREKLKIYLKTPEKVEIYAAACEKFYLNGGKNGLKRAMTWSWWGFFFTYGFLINRKNYAISIFYFIFLIIASVLTMICCGMYAKWHVCKRFLEILEIKDDDVLMAKGGKNTAVAFISLIIGGLISSFIGSMMFSSGDFNSDKFGELNSNLNSNSSMNFFTSIEAPEIEIGQGSIVIIGKDDYTEILDIVVNRGNCPVQKYAGGNIEKVKAYAANHRENIKPITEDDMMALQSSVATPMEVFTYTLAGMGTVDAFFYGGADKSTVLYFDTKDGRKVLAENFVYFDNEVTNKYLNSLVDEARNVYDSIFPLGIKFGERAHISIDCDYSTIKEITLKTNGGNFKYNDFDFNIAF